MQTRTLTSRALTLGVRALALASVALLVPGRWAVGFATTGESLALDQRDVRVFDNFTDPEANQNTVPDPSFPGYVGAELAIWKGVLEWGSELHFQGDGDPHQPGDLGSGGANFDPTWQGSATEVGGADDNIMSEISGQGIGTLAFTETPTGDGWRIRFYSNPWIWFDNPFGSTATAFHSDLQGVACHEYGHALGLDHTTVSDSTMFATARPNDVEWRSIEPDDIAGVQFIYGAASPTKPSIERYELLAGGQVRLIGTNFAATGNEVWFTRGAGVGDGTPVIAAGLAADPSRTEIVLLPPPEAGPGDVLVRVPGTAHASLSNAFPFDPAIEPCPLPRAYGTAKINSSGGPAELSWEGTPRVSTQDFRVRVDGGPAGEVALLFWGDAPKDVPFLGGRLLVRHPRKRGVRRYLNGFGGASLPVDVTPDLVGVTRYFQVWYRDAFDPFGAGTTDALEVTFCQ